MEKHQRDNNQQRTKDAKGWSRLTRITNNKLEHFQLAFQHVQTVN